MHGSTVTCSCSAVRAYEFVTPDFVETRVADFFDNIGEIPTFVNGVLQLKPEIAGRAATRFIVNTMFTAGLFDLAGAQGVEQVREDFGQTLAAGAPAMARFWSSRCSGPRTCAMPPAASAMRYCCRGLRPGRWPITRRTSRSARAAADRRPLAHRVSLLRNRLAVRVRPGSTSIHRDTCARDRELSRPLGVDTQTAYQGSRRHCGRCPRAHRPAQGSRQARRRLS